MHATRNSAHSGDVEGPGLSMCERIENAQLEILMRIQSCESGVIAAGVHVVDQEAHAHATIRRPQQRINKDVADDVVVNQEVLRIDAALGPLRHQQPQGERIDAIEDRVEAGLFRRVLRRGPGNAAAKVSVARVGECK